MEIRGKLPRDIIVGFAFVLGKYLRREEIDCVIAIGLIETNDVGACWEVALFESDGVLGAGNFDALLEETAHHVGNAFAISLIFRDEIGVGRFIESLAPRVPAFFVEIAKHLFGVASGKVKSGKRAGFRVVEVVALGPVKFSGRRSGAVPLHGGL